MNSVDSHKDVSPNAPPASRSLLNDPACLRRSRVPRSPASVSPLFRPRLSPAFAPSASRPPPAVSRPRLCPAFARFVFAHLQQSPDPICPRRSRVTRPPASGSSCPVLSGVCQATVLGSPPRLTSTRRSPAPSRPRPCPVQFAVPVLVLVLFPVFIRLRFAAHPRDLPAPDLHQPRLGLSLAFARLAFARL